MSHDSSSSESEDVRTEGDCEVDIGSEDSDCEEEEDYYVDEETGEKCDNENALREKNKEAFDLLYKLLGHSRFTPPARSKRPLPPVKKAEPVPKKQRTKLQEDD